MSFNLLGSLPAPRNVAGGGGSMNMGMMNMGGRPQGNMGATSSSSALVMRGNGAPPYGKRKGFFPKRPEDFGDGGAFPEIHVSQ